jgi:hypothetical protein
MVLNSSTAPDSSPQGSGIVSNPGVLTETGETLPARAVRAYSVRRARIDCLDGELWVTGPGIGDAVLLRGESIVVPKPGKVVIQALVASRARVRAAD